MCLLSRHALTLTCALLHRVALDGCSSLGEIENLLMKTGRRWLGLENAAGSVAEDQMDRMR
jgi:hypothetical protein